MGRLDTQLPAADGWPVSEGRRDTHQTDRTNAGNAPASEGWVAERPLELRENYIESARERLCFQRLVRPLVRRGVMKVSLHQLTVGWAEEAGQLQPHQALQQSLGRLGDFPSHIFPLVSLWVGGGRE